MTTTPASVDAARTQTLMSRGRPHYRLVLPRHPDLRVHLSSTSTRWYYRWAMDGTPAAWDIEWTYRVSATTDRDADSYKEQGGYEAGSFVELSERLEVILSHPYRVPGSEVTLSVSEPALHFQPPLLDHLPDCVQYADQEKE